MVSDVRSATTSPASGANDQPFQRRRLDGLDPDDVPASTLMIEVDGVVSVRRARRRARILDQVAWVISDTLRVSDAVFRHSDAGFCAVLAATPDDEALAAANRISANVASMPLLADAGITLSVGVASGSGSNLADTIARAEAAVATASDSNRVVCAARA